MKQQLLFIMLVAATGLCTNANAKIWRVNNNAGVIADFTSFNAAVTSASVVNGDTLHFEASATSYGDAVLTKRLVLLGTGYFLSGSNSNAGLQANTNAAQLGGINIDTLGSGSIIDGLQVLYIANRQNQGYGADNITITRCYIANSSFYDQCCGTQSASNTNDGWKINKCYINNINASAASRHNWDVENNIFTSAVDLSNAANAGNVVRNNVFRGSVNVYNGYFANNIIVNTTITLTNTVAKNNLVEGQPSSFSSYQGTNGNSWNYNDAQLFQGITSNSTDGQWRLATSSPAISAGLTVGSVTTPDCGAFGGPDPYILSGIPPIPTIYTLTVPASIPTGATSMTVTFSTKSNP
ncbi:MAG: hypothetical protein PW786_00610 [Arachidicoccus sp.]|nr:hypothetical protein [Arachidicoccus sp.]